MTIGVKQAPVPATGRPDTDKPGARGRAAGPGFGDALKLDKHAKHGPAGKAEPRGKPVAADLPPRWTTFEARLHAGEVSGQATLRTIAELMPGEAEKTGRIEGGDRELPKKHSRDVELEQDDDAVDGGGAFLSSAPVTPSLWLPPHSRRLPDKESREPRIPEIGARRGLEVVEAGENAARTSDVGPDMGEEASVPAAKPASATTGRAVAAQYLAALASTTGEPADPAASPEPKHADAARPLQHVTILSAQNVPAPMSVTATLVTEAIVADGAFLPALDKPALELRATTTVALPAHSLTIELHPAELGAVTANLRVIGERLSIELKVENQDAHRRLSADSEAIVKSLRAIGYDIDRVTVLQPQIAVSATARTDAGAPLSGQPTRGGEFGSGAAGGESTGTGGQRAGGDGGNARQDNQRQASGQGNRSGGGLFI